jgi:DNA-binding beta-propeller fold protein YncE
LPASNPLLAELIVRASHPLRRLVGTASTVRRESPVVQQRGALATGQSEDGRDVPPSRVRVHLAPLLLGAACGSTRQVPDARLDDARAPAFDAPSAVDASSDGAPGPQDSAVPDGALPPPPRFVRSWGGYGTLEGQFVEPSSVELLGDGIVIVAGHEDRVQRFTRDGALIDIFGGPGAGDGQFNHPHGLAVDRAQGDVIYVGDQENHRLQVFTRDGVFLRQWGDAQFAHIHDVGIDPATGDVFVGDYELDTVRKFSPEGALLATFGGPGAGTGLFSGVWGISTDSFRNLYVADTFNRRVQKLDPEGAFVLEWNRLGNDAFVKPTGVFVDSRDIVYVCDSLAQSVGLFDTDGTLLQRWDLAEMLPMATEPEDIVIDAEGRHVYIAEVRNHRVWHLIRD